MENGCIRTPTSSPSSFCIFFTYLRQISGSWLASTYLGSHEKENYLKTLPYICGNVGKTGHRDNFTRLYILTIYFLSFQDLSLDGSTEVTAGAFPRRSATFEMLNRVICVNPFIAFAFIGCYFLC